MKYKVGDIVYHKSAVNGRGLYQIQATSSEGVIGKRLWREGAIIENIILTKWAIKSPKYLNSHIATSQEIESMAFPEGIANVKANVEAGNIKLTGNMVCLFEAITLNISPVDGLIRVTNTERMGAKCKQCQPIRYESFNMVYNICKICDKNLD